MAGKVLVSTAEHIRRLVAARLQADIMGAETVIVARTDAEAATLLDRLVGIQHQHHHFHCDSHTAFFRGSRWMFCLCISNIDPRDHTFILGSTVEGVGSLQQALDKNPGSKKAWEKKARVMTFPALVKAILRRQVCLEVA
jgi:isocitrate lyase